MSMGNARYAPIPVRRDHYRDTCGSPVIKCLCFAGIPVVAQS